MICPILSSTNSSFKIGMMNLHPIMGLVLLLNLFYPTDLDAQTINYQELKSLFTSADTGRQDYGKALRESENEIDLTISTLFLTYKTLISSQDTPKCIFTPSCSVYAVQAYQKKGLFIGWLSTFDRLSRCHGLVDPRHYPIDPDKKRFYDPVE